jgi:hypothetical protein
MTIPLSYGTSVIQLDPTGRPLPGFGMSREFGIWLNDALIQPTAVAPKVSTSIPLASQSASVPTTPFPLGSVSSGTYRLTYYARITQAATVSSSLAVTIGWTDGGAQSHTFPAITGNTTTTTDSQTWMVVVSGAPLTYATTYSSSGATPMQYALTVTVEAIP